MSKTNDPSSRAHSIIPVKSNKPPARRLGIVLLSISLAALSVTSCSKLNDVTGSIGLPSQMPSDEQGIRAFGQTPRGDPVIMLVYV